jgi:hypothetical protein
MIPVIKDKDKDKTKNKSGFVYVMKNESSVDNRYKVGMTKRDPSIRAKELSTSYADEFIVVYYKRMKDAHKAEKKVFQLLREYMPSAKKEVVDVYDVDMIKSVIDYVAETEGVFN